MGLVLNILMILALYLVTVRLLQLVIRKYMGNKSDSGSSSRIINTDKVSTPWQYMERTDVDQHNQGNHVRCPHCGARNERSYKYCQNCVEKISA